jgi:hypothetical protein
VLGVWRGDTREYEENLLIGKNAEPHAFSVDSALVFSTPAR